MKIATLLTLFLFTIYAWSQPVLNYNASHGIGTQSTTSIIGGSTTTLQNTGAGITWDLSANTLTSVGTLELVDPKNTPYASTYTNANLCFKWSIAGQGVSYDYFIDTATNLSSIANGIGGLNPTIWTSYDKILKYPFNIYNTFNATRTPSNGSPETYLRSYDAYGTLKINNKTFTNVALITKFPGNSVWFTTAPVIFPILIQANSTTFLYNEPTNLSGLSITQNHQDVLLYPNPIQAGGNLQVSGLLAQDEYQIQLTDILGKVLKLANINAGTPQVELSMLAPGIYNYQLTNGEGYLKNGKVTLF